MPNFTPFLSYVLVTTFTPGPNTIMSMSNASRYGFKRTTIFNLGIFSGFFIVMGLCNIFSVTLYNLIPSIKPVMTIFGAAYIMWLGWKTYNSKPNNTTENKNQTNTFLTGFLFQFINVKLIIYGLTTTSTFIVPYYNSPLTLAGFSLFLSVMSFAATTSWALFGSIFKKFLDKNSKLVNSLMALLLVYCALSLFR